MAEFQIVFELTSNLSGDAYRSFIVQLRNRAADPSYQTHGIRVLLPQANPPTRFFDVVLRTTTRAVRFRLRRDNLYLDGFRNEWATLWYEFRNNGNQRLIAGSQFLPYTGSYIALERVAGDGRQNIRLGRAALTTAVNNLVNLPGGSAWARSLIIVIQMLSESMRFTYIIDEIRNTFTAANGLLPSARILALENGWGDLSAAILHTDNNPTARFRLSTPNFMQVSTLTQAILVIAVLLRQHPAGSAAPRTDMDVDTAAPGPFILSGRPLVEVFYVRIVNIDRESPGQLYGKIMATDGLQSYYLFNRDRKDYQSVKPGEKAILSGPGRAISAAGDFVIKFNLLDADSLSPDDEISKGQVEWNVFDHTNVFDRVKTDTIRGKYGAAELNYVVMRNAAEAMIEVILISGDGESPAEVYGRLWTKTTKYTTEIDLFNRTNKNYVSVRPNSRIPLLRSAVAVPMDGSLSVGAYLWDYDSLSPDDEIANGTAVFKPDIWKTTPQETIISGKHGKVRVKVTWI